MFLAKRTETDFQEWREHQAWTAEKYRRFDNDSDLKPVEASTPKILDPSPVAPYVPIGNEAK